MYYNSPKSKSPTKSKSKSPRKSKSPTKSKSKSPRKSKSLTKSKSKSPRKSKSLTKSKSKSPTKSKSPRKSKSPTKSKSKSPTKSKSKSPTKSKSKSPRKSKSKSPRKSKSPTKSKSKSPRKSKSKSPISKLRYIPYSEQLDENGEWRNRNPVKTADPELWRQFLLDKYTTKRTGCEKDYNKSCAFYDKKLLLNKTFKQKSYDDEEQKTPTLWKYIIDEEQKRIKFYNEGDKKIDYIIESPNIDDRFRILSRDRTPPIRNRVVDYNIPRPKYIKPYTILLYNPNKMVKANI